MPRLVFNQFISAKFVIMPVSLAKVFQRFDTIRFYCAQIP